MKHENSETEYRSYPSTASEVGYQKENEKRSFSSDVNLLTSDLNNLEYHEPQETTYPQNFANFNNLAGEMKPKRKCSKNVFTPDSKYLPNQFEQAKRMQIFNHNSNTNNNQQILYTPMGMSMPKRTFAFKKNNKKSKNFHQKPNSQKAYINDQNQMGINSKNQPNDLVALEIESMLIKKGKFDINIYTKLKGTFVNLIKNQQTSRVCQYYLDQSHSEVIHLIFKELSPNLTNLLLDQYANYFCLKIFYFLNSNDRLEFIKNITPFLPTLCINKISTYPIQCIVERLSSITEQKLFLSHLNNSFIQISLDLYGTHVIERAFTNLNYDLVKPFSLMVLDSFLFLSTNPNGICVVKKVINLEYKNDNYEKLKSELMKNSLILIQNPYGNYALQEAILNWDLSDILDVIRSYYGKCSFLSIQKYSSNVIEKCILKSEEFLFNFIQEICTSNERILLLLNNNYGHYVLQTALKNANLMNKMVLVNTINSNLDQLTNPKSIKKWRRILVAQGSDAGSPN